MLIMTWSLPKKGIKYIYLSVYELEVLPLRSTQLGDLYESNKLDESIKWFMDEEKVGHNRPLMNDFIELAKKNEETHGASICFLISLNQEGTYTIYFYYLK